MVTGVRFIGGLLGPRELCFKFQKFEEFVRINVTPGPPAKITLLEAPEQVNTTSTCAHRNVSKAI